MHQTHHRHLKWNANQCHPNANDVDQNLPFFDVELPALTFLLLLFEFRFAFELTTDVTLPLELVLDIVEAFGSFCLAFALFAADCIFDTVWLLASTLPVPLSWTMALGALTTLAGSSQKQFAFPLPNGIGAFAAFALDCSLPQMVDHCETDDHFSSFLAFCCFCWAA